MKRGRKPRADVLREPNGRISRSREGRLKAGTMIYADYAVYFAAGLDGFTKIGFSGNLQNRLSHLSTVQAETVRIVGLVLVPSEILARKLEHTLHRRFAALRHKGEWFLLSEANIQTALSECRALKLKTIGLEEPVESLGIPWSSLYRAEEQTSMRLLRIAA